MGYVIHENNTYSYYEHEFLPNSCHGTGEEKHWYGAKFEPVLYKLIQMIHE